MGGAGLLLSLVTAAILYIPWDRLPTAGRLRGNDRLCAQSTGDDRLLIALKNLGDKAVNPRYFVLSLAVILVGLTLTQVVSLATGNKVYVETKESGAGPKS